MTNAHLKISRADSNPDSRVRKRNGGEASSPTNLDKGLSCKKKDKKQYLQVRRQPVKIKHACCMDPDIPQINVKY